MTLRVITAGESHGPGLTCVVEGLPAGLELDPGAINADMARRQLGHGRGGRMKIESDAVEIRSGVRHGRTLGSPVAVLVANRDYANWEERMNPWPVEAEVEESHLPRPGHADLAGLQKYGFSDVRNVLERASARETAARVAAGSLAKEFLRALGVSVHSHVIQIASVAAPVSGELGREDFAGVDDSPVRCLDPGASEQMVAEIDRLRKENESLGGKFEVRAFGLVPGLGSHVSWRQKLDGRLAQAVMAVQAIKGVEIGLGFEAARRRGSQVHDPIHYDASRKASPTLGYERPTNNAGGLEAGMTNGQPIIIRAAKKPISTLRKPLDSINLDTKEPEAASYERSDVCAISAASVIVENVVAFEVAAALIDKFGGDSLQEMQARHKLFLEMAAER